MKKICIMAALCAALAFTGCVNEVIPDGGFIDGGRSIARVIDHLYKVADGYEMGAWNCWDSADSTATIEIGEDGGVRLTALKRPCDATYFGVNLAAGSGSGATADLDCRSVKKIEFEVRGTIPSDMVTFYMCGKTNGDKKDERSGALEKPASAYNASSWTKLSFEVSPDDLTAQGFVCSVDNNPDGWETQWIEIRNIDWQDASGGSVVPKYVK